MNAHKGEGEAQAKIGNAGKDGRRPNGKCSQGARVVVEMRQNKSDG